MKTILNAAIVAISSYFSKEEINDVQEMPFLPESTCFSWTDAFAGTCPVGYYNSATHEKCDSFNEGPSSCAQKCCFEQSSYSGWSYNPPTENIFWTLDTCNDYNPYDVHWKGFQGDLLQYLSQDGGELGPEKIPYKRLAAMLIRAAFHDAGSYNKSETFTGGADGSFVLAEPEQRYPGNNLKFGFAPYVRATLDPLVTKYRTSWADAIAIGGAVGARFLGYSHEFVMEIGRCDSNVANPKVLPDFAARFNDFVNYFDSVGLSLQEATALMGSHSVVEDGKGHSDGTQQYFWSNRYYTDQLAGKVTLTLDSFIWTAGVWQYTANDVYLSPQHVDPKCPFAKKYKKIQLKYATDENHWNQNYADAYRKMCNIGAKFANKRLCTLIVTM